MNTAALIGLTAVVVLVDLPRVHLRHETSDDNLFKPLFSSDEVAVNDWLPIPLSQEKTDFHKIEGRSLKRKILKAPDSFYCTFQGKLAIPNECSKHYVCERPGMRSTFGYCSEPKQFHHQKRACLTISKKQCRASMCKDSTDRFPDPYSKENYLTCYRMFPEVLTCSEGKIFSNKAKTCVPGFAMDGLKASSENDTSGEFQYTNKSTRKSNSTKNGENELTEDDRWSDRGDDRGSKHADDHHGAEGKKEASSGHGKGSSDHQQQKAKNTASQDKGAGSSSKSPVQDGPVKSKVTVNR